MTMATIDLLHRPVAPAYPTHDLLLLASPRNVLRSSSESRGQEARPPKSRQNRGSFTGQDASQKDTNSPPSSPPGGSAFSRLPTLSRVPTLSRKATLGNRSGGLNRADTEPRGPKLVKSGTSRLLPEMWGRERTFTRSIIDQIRGTMGEGGSSWGNSRAYSQGATGDDGDDQMMSGPLGPSASFDPSNDASGALSPRRPSLLSMSAAVPHSEGSSAPPSGVPGPSTKVPKTDLVPNHGMAGGGAPSSRALVNSCGSFDGVGVEGGGGGGEGDWAGAEEGKWDKDAHTRLKSVLRMLGSASYCRPLLVEYGLSERVLEDMARRWKWEEVKALGAVVKNAMYMWIEHASIVSGAQQRGQCTRESSPHCRAGKRYGCRKIALDMQCWVGCHHLDCTML